jgi:hypothetical protein
MPILLNKDSVSKGSPASFTLDRSALVPLVSDSFFQDTSNWSKIILFYKSDTGGQKSKVIFDATQASPAANFLISEKARDIFEINSIIIYDFDKGYYEIPRASLPPAEFDVVIASGYRNFLDPNSIEAGESFQGYMYGTKMFANFVAEGLRVSGAAPDNAPQDGGYNLRYTRMGVAPDKGFTPGSKTYKLTFKWNVESKAQSTAQANNTNSQALNFRLGGATGSIYWGALSLGPQITEIPLSGDATTNPLGYGPGSLSISMEGSYGQSIVIEYYEIEEVI